MVSPGVKSGLLMGFGSVLVVLGAVVVVYWPSLFMSQLKSMMALTPKSASFGIWRETPIPMYLECFLFNISNVDDILARKNVTLEVVQLGPYVFREVHEKVNIHWNSNDTVTFYNQRYWHFEPEMSNGSLSDVITSINPVIVTAAYSMRYQRAAVNMIVDTFLRLFHSNMFTSAPARAWLFDGIDDPLLDVANDIPFLPLPIPFEKFGWFYARNGSIEYDGVFVMNTGTADFSRLGMVELWRNSNRTFYREECGEVKGSTGELWAPELGQPEVVIFAPDMCTYMTLSKDKEVEVEGIEGVQYAANDSVFDNGHKYPRMACYCDEPGPDCVPSGALNVSLCRYGAPAFVSLPHMYGADPHYPSKVSGLQPLESHRFRLSLEMYTGMPLQVSAQLQINLLVRHIAGFAINNQLPDPDTLVPMFWFRQEMQVTPEYARLAKAALRARYWVPYGLYVTTALGGILLIWGVFLLTRRIMRSPETTPIMNETGSEENLAAH